MPVFVLNKHIFSSLSNEIAYMRTYLLCVYVYMPCFSSIISKMLMSINPIF